MAFSSDVVIGLEIHVGIDTASKLFCGCPTKGDERPDSRTCETCLGMPGSKPVLNRKAIEFGMRIALALGCKIAPELVFSRKSYFYPDLAKDYQITQYELPLGEHGRIVLPGGKEVGITRVHLEEDPASLVHTGKGSERGQVLVDYNRSGNPLCEIVTEPDLESPEDARLFMKTLLNILNYLDVFSTDTGVLKADCNISIRESGYVRSEIKNVNGFREIERALDAEVERQKRAAEEGSVFIQDTRGWDTGLGSTFRMRTKETEDDYGYILDPDLVAVPLCEEMVKTVRESIPELPGEKAARFTEEFGIDGEDAMILCSERSLADLFERVAGKFKPSLAVRWLRHELNRFLNLKEKSFGETGADPAQIVELLALLSERRITDATGREILEKLLDARFSPEVYIKEHGLESVSDTGELEGFCRKVMDENPAAVEDLKAGKEKSLNFLMGKVMRLTKGKASPDEVVRIIRDLVD